MPDFNPSPHERIVIGGQPYQVMPHPAVPSFAFGQEGRKAFVFQIYGGPEQGLHALKKFKEAFRLKDLVEICDQLARFAAWPGLEVCDRECLHAGRHDDILSIYPDLEYAVLMPWISGSTWYDMVIGMTPLSRLEALTFAKAAAQVLAAIEEAGLAHCDVSAANMIINPTTQHAHLIDVEDLYAPGFAPPAALPAGTEGYAHRTASEGLWSPCADRFAGAVIMSEMLAWHSPEIRKKAEDEHYFSQDEMQQDSPRYRLMRAVLEEVDPRLSELFERAWFSDRLEDCPRLKEWQEVISDVQHREQVAGVVSDWKPLSIPAVMQPDAAPRPFSRPEPALEAAPPVADASESAPSSAPGELPQPAPSVQPAPLASPPASLQSERPGPATPVIQPIMPPAAQPQARPRPIQVQPPHKTGGPVVEWRPLIAPSPAASPETTAQERHMVWQPILPMRQADGQADAAPEEPTATLPVETVTAEPEPAVEFAPIDTGIPESAGPEPVPTLGDTPSAEVVAHEPLSSSGEIVSAEDAVEEVYPDTLSLDKVEEVKTAEAARFWLLKPILDLSHIDERNRPHLVWSESPGAEHYVLQEDSTPGFDGPKEYRIKGNETRWSPPWGPLWRRSGRLYYRVCAQAGEERGPWSEVVMVRIGGG